MTDPGIKADRQRSRTGKLIMQMAIGAVVGGALAYAFLAMVGKDVMSAADPARIVAMILGIVLVLMGLFVGFGTAAPKAGAHLLNVEDESELREQRAALGLSAVTIVLLGGIMLALAVATVGERPGALPASLAAIIIGSCLVALIALSYYMRNDYDELMLAVSAEASAWAMYACLTLFTVWGSLAHLGYATWISPLGLVCALMVIELAAIIIATARRGLLKTR